MSLMIHWKYTKTTDLRLLLCLNWFSNPLVKKLRSKHIQQIHKYPLNITKTTKTKHRASVEGSADEPKSLKKKRKQICNPILNFPRPQQKQNLELILKCSLTQHWSNTLVKQWKSYSEQFRSAYLSLAERMKALEHQGRRGSLIRLGALV